ncbi:MAG: alpha-amylase, partial [Nitrospinota bacterium]
ENSDKTPYEQLREINARARSYGLKTLVDLVISHSASDSKLLVEHPEWYKWESPGKVHHPFCHEDGKKVVWRDLAKFDPEKSKDREGLLEFFFEGINYLLESGFSGFRCDAAYQIPRWVWERLIRRTKKVNKETVFLAETLGCTAEQTRETAKAGFDYIFNSSKWWDYHDTWMMAQYNLTRDIAPSISFPESHDTDRLSNELDGNVDGIKQRYLFSSLFSSAVMMPVGYEFGFKKRVHVVHTKPGEEERGDIDISGFIQEVNRIKGTYSVFCEEAPTEILQSNNPNVLLMWKGSVCSSEEALLILNKDIYSKQHFYSENVYNYVQARAPLKDVSPEFPLDFIPEPYSYDLRPGQGIVLITRRD